ncbi:ABC transporter substrate-binding protein [Cellulosilyticum ruminicola]|uniref:ABC transporter substrate-binding protein n=1 Tax=Cellulosilyticum ruminicola TaxID=425254 RepID=UPI0006D065A2|nr:extracellular solute-binding protein [Cellulosilyticum ruminicola]
MEDDKIIDRIIVGIVVFLGLILSILLFRIHADVQKKNNYARLNQEKKIIKIWTLHGDMQTMLEEVTQKYENDTIGFEITSFKNEVYQSNIQNAAITNELPDIFFTWGYSNLEKYVKLGLVADITQSVKETNFEETCLPKAFDGMTFENKIYALPIYGWNVGLFCNKALFKQYGVEYPTTYEKFINAIKVFKTHNITPLAGGMKEQWLNSLYYMALVLGEGDINGIYDAAMDMKKFDTPQFKNAAKKMAEISRLNPWQTTYMDNDAYDASYLFVQGGAAMLVYGSWVSSRIAGDESIIADEVEVMPFPNDNPGYNIGGYSDLMVISKNSQMAEDEELKKLYLDMMYDISQLAITKYGVGLPAYKDQVINPVQFKTLYGCSKINEEKGEHPAYDQILNVDQSTIYYDALARLVKGEMDENQFISRMSE